MSRWPYILNTAWMWSCSRERRAFQAATHDVATVQTRLLLELTKRNSETVYGKSCHFRQISSAKEFQARVPLTNYDDYQPQMDLIAAGEQKILTSDRVEILEPTSGTTSGEKLIPYTAELRRQFQRAISAWIADLYHHRPAIRKGRAYWSLSPAFGAPRTTSGGIPIGFDDDTAYLGSIERLFIQHLLAVPATVAKVHDVEEFRYATLFHLLLADDLSLISVWNPTFLTVLFDSLPEWTDRICHDLRTANVSSRRRNEVTSILNGKRTLAEMTQLLWRDLALISCWTDAGAAFSVGQLQAMFPNVELQSKGLIATEAAISFPLVDRPGAALALRSHFFEFKPASSSDACDIRLAHELDLGGQYEIIVTTGGGLYRYQLHDLVEVVGFENQCPLLRFLGKTNRVSDLVGEKLSEPHATAVLNRAFSELQLPLPQARLRPIRGAPPHYQLQVTADLTAQQRSVLLAIVERGLRENPYYQHAIAMRQLGPLDLSMANKESKTESTRLDQAHLSGQKPGDIKPSVFGTT